MIRLRVLGIKVCRSPIHEKRVVIVRGRGTAMRYFVQVFVATYPKSSPDMTLTSAMQPVITQKSTHLCAHGKSRSFAIAHARVRCRFGPAAMSLSDSVRRMATNSVICKGILVCNTDLSRAAARASHTHEHISLSARQSPFGCDRNRARATQPCACDVIQAPRKKHGKKIF